MMAATTTSSNLSARLLSEDASKREDVTLAKLKAELERVRLENKKIQRELDVERNGVRALKAQHEGSLRRLSSEAKRKQQILEKQIRNIPRARDADTQPDPALRKLSAEVQALKATNEALHEKLETAEQNARDAGEQVRAQLQQHASEQQIFDKQARTQIHVLLEELKSKDRIIEQLKKSTSPAPAHNGDKQIRRMEHHSREIRKLSLDQDKKADREDLNTDIQHRKETFHREMSSDMDSAVCSAPQSLSPQPPGSVDMWSCSHCRAAMERAEDSARESVRLADALRDAREQLELLEFRVLELEDAAPEKVGRDSDSGCVSPGSRLQDAASPELRRTDSGYKSPVFASPTLHRRLLADNVLCDQIRTLLSRASSAEEQSCLQQVLTLLQDLHLLTTAANVDIQQLQTKKLGDVKSKLEPELSPVKSPKVIATVSPYSQTRRSLESSSLESLCDEPRKICRLQESGIFDDVETDEKSTQTEVYESLECGDLNTEIQRLNSIREKLERRGVARSSPLKSDEEGLECRCVKLGKRHKQYYERRLKFLEGKISIYEAAQDVKKAKLAQRLQKEFVLENRVEDLESQLSCLQEKYRQLEEDCCELEELENDTRLHAQQLETDYELVTAQLQDMSEQRECSRAQAEKLARLLRDRESQLKTRLSELTSRLSQLERAIPALIAFNVVRALGGNVNKKGQTAVSNKLGSLTEKAAVVERIRQQSRQRAPCQALVVWRELQAPERHVTELQAKMAALTQEKKTIEVEAAKQKAALERQIQDLRAELQAVAVNKQKHKDNVDNQMREVEKELAKMSATANVPVDAPLAAQIHQLIQSERALGGRVRELERREAAYLDMLTQADDMWAEMEGGYKKKIQKANKKMSELERERDRLSSSCAHARKQTRDLEQAESGLRVALEKTERDLRTESSRALALQGKLSASEANLTMSQTMFKQLSEKYQAEIGSFRQKTASLAEQLETEKEQSALNESKFNADLEKLRKDLSRTCKNVQDLEVTTAELREEVESLENQLSLMQKALVQCKRKCDDKVKTISRELSIKTEELEELRSDVMRRTLRPSVFTEMRDCTEYVHDSSYLIPQRYGYDTHQSLGFITSETRCSCPTTRSRLVGSLIEDLFERMHDTKDPDLAVLCNELTCPASVLSPEIIKAKVSEYLMMAISKELVRSIGDADAKADNEEWRLGECSGDVSAPSGNAGVVSGAERLASVSCACAAARLCTSLPALADTVKTCQEEVLVHGDVKIMEEQLASAIENIVNCPSCALGSNAIVWSTDV